MAKDCLHIGCYYSRFGGGFCKMHQYKREDKKSKPLNNTPIRKVSVKRSKENLEYLRERMKFLNDKICPITGNSATEIHHINGRSNKRLLDKKYWLAVTREGHNKIHANPIWARENNYLI